MQLAFQRIKLLCFIILKTVFFLNSQILVEGLSINLKLLWVKGNMQVRVPCRRLLYAYLISTSFLELVSGALQLLGEG